MQNHKYQIRQSMRHYFDDKEEVLKPGHPRLDKPHQEQLVYSGLCWSQS